MRREWKHIIVKRVLETDRRPGGKIPLDSTRLDEQRRQGRKNGDSCEVYRDLLKTTKQARVGYIILSGILPEVGNRIQGYRNSKRMAVNGMVGRLCK